ncbi:phenylalanine--tRNA ligase subunit beta [Candidatus Woesearchaeota archaeon]|nr:phenylalanine--tRNA ligase subunit beta [Candidatus Woesearchaeota archaeon]
MPTVTLNKPVFEQLVGKKLPLEELKDRISMLGTDLESIEGDEIQVEIFPNRPDMLSEQGFARAFSSFIGVKTGLRNYNVKKSGLKVIVDKSVTMRPYTACAIVKNLHFDDERIREIMQVQEKLATTHGRNRKKSAYGIYPLESINFPISYIAKDPSQVTFRPLGFDTEIIAAQVPELHPKGKAYLHLTQGWKKYPFFIDAKSNIMCMLPFTNSHDTGKVTTKTKEVFVECTGNDLTNVQFALNMITTTLADMGGEVYSLDIVYPDKTIITPNLTPTKMPFDLAYINKWLGLTLNEKQAKEMLEKMGYGYEKASTASSKATVLIPAYRADILHQVDLAEDIAIAYGYENFPEEIPNVSTIGEEDPLEKFINVLRELFVGGSFIEIKNYHLLQKEQCNEWMLQENGGITLKNAVGEHNTLRHSIIPSLLKTLSENQHNEYPQNIFETGHIFYPAPTETGVQEVETFGVAICQDKADFTQIRQQLDLLFTLLGLEIKIKETAHPSFIKGRVGEIYLGKEKVGIIGEIHPQVLENWKIVTPVVAFEINVESLFNAVKK